MIATIKRFFQLESASGVVLVAAAVLALIIANSPLSPFYDALLATPVEVRIGQLEIAKPLLLWINDGLMAVFFFLVGLELKRELLEGHLSNPSQMVLPLIGAIGGMASPALIYVAVARHDPIALRGWAIPSATDIAFALGILATLGSRVPLSLKVFLTSLAVIDDLGAIIIIAIFYSSDLSLLSIGIAGAMMLVLFILNRSGVTTLAPYIMAGVIMWVAVLKSGVHATLAGVALAMFIPMRARDHHGHSPLMEMEHSIKGLVAFGILPIFAFANAGVPLHGLGMDDLVAPVTLGTVLGLFIGKQLGVFIPCWLLIKTGLAKKPTNASMMQLYAVALLCGVGFTMSLFIGSLAFESAPSYQGTDRLGILLGSLLSAVCGYILMRMFSKENADG